MKLLYCHVGFLDANGNKKRFRGLEQINLNLSSSHVFSYDSCDSVLRKRLRDKPLPEHFWANGDKETNLYNINVVAGKNGSGKSTVINYVIDLLYYIYLDFGRQQSNIPKSARFDVEQNYNLLVFEENGSLYVVELLPEGKKKTTRKKCKVFEGGEKIRVDEVARIIRGRNDCSEKAKKFKDLFNATKVVYMMNNPTQRDYERNLYRQEGGLRNYYVYDCSLGANLGGQIEQFFPYEVYKQVRYLFDGNQVEIRKEIERRIRKATKGRKETGETSQHKPDELVMPRALRVRPRINMLKDGLIQKLTPSYSTDTIRGFSDKEPDLNVVLGELCCRAFAENAALLFDLKTGQLFNTYSDSDESEISVVEYLPYRPEVKHGSVLEEQKHCLHAIANIVDSISRRVLGRNLVVDCCAVLPDGNIISGFGDGTIRIWNADTGECLQALKGHTDLVTCFAVLRDGRIASGSEDKTIRIWNVNTGECLQPIKGHTGPVTCLATLPSGCIVSGSSDNTIPEPPALINSLK
jgi:FOG: WD40 repeat